MQWIWLFVIIIAIILDVFTSDFLFAGFALGGFAGLIFSFLGISIIPQIIAFGIIGILFIFTLYPIIKKKMNKDKLGTDRMEDTYIGSVITLDKDLSDEALIKFNGIYWTFKTITGPINSGDVIKIVKIDGNKLIVEKNN